MKDDREADKYHAVEEATEAIRNLSPEHKRKLERAANRRAWFSGDHRGLLSEAVAATAEGRRRWSKSVDIVRHLDQVMRNISSNARRRKEVASGNLEETASRSPWRDEELSTEQALEDRETREEMHATAIALCEDDDEVKMLVEALLDNWEPDECVALFGDKLKYETVRKRMNRRIKNFRAKGGVQ